MVLGVLARRRLNQRGLMLLLRRLLVLEPLLAQLVSWLALLVLLLTLLLPWLGLLGLLGLLPMMLVPTTGQGGHRWEHQLRLRRRRTILFGGRGSSTR